MKNLIYQYWDGDYSRPGVRAGVHAMKKYAERIGVEYIFEKNPRYARSLGYNFGSYTPHYGAFKPVFEDWQYDNILFADIDVFPVEGLTDNIFDEPIGDIGICKENWQTLNKPKSDRDLDKRWATYVENQFSIKIPRDDNGNVITYNAGVVLYSKKSYKKIRDNFVPFDQYVKCIRNKFPLYYESDQPYLHAMMQRIDWTELNEDWNRCIHHYPKTIAPHPVNDPRTPTTKFVHIQFDGADDWSEEKLWRITNLPENEWKL